MARSEPALDWGADLAVFESESGVGDGRIDDFRFRHGAKVEVLLFQATLGGKRREAQAVLQSRFGRLGVRYRGKYDLLDVPALRRRVAAAVLLERGLDVRIGDFHPLAEIGRRRRDDLDLAVFRSPEQNFSRLEILAEFVRSRLRNLTSLRRAKRHVFDVSLFALELVDGLEPCFRHREIAGKRVEDLPPQHYAALLTHKPLLAETGVAQELFEAAAVELAGRTAKCRIVGNTLHDLGVGKAEARHLARPLVKSRFGDQFTQHLAIDAESLRLFRGKRSARSGC